MYRDALWNRFLMKDSDELLLERLRRNDGAAFEGLFLRHYGQVYRVVYRLVGRREEAEDMTQETFLALYHHPPRLAGGATLIAWLCRVALNRGYNTLRGERREQQRLQRVADTPPDVDPQAEAERAEERARVRSALSCLPERQGKVLLLRYAGLSYAEIAEALDVAPGSVGTLLARAERAFQAMYAGDVTAHEPSVDSKVP